MELNEYQKQAMTTCLRSSRNTAYMMFGLMEEVGELSGKISKLIRKDKVIIRDNILLPLHLFDPEELQEFIGFDEELCKEAGDVLWMLAGLCEVMGWSLEDIAQLNLEKLASRKQRGVIDGNGDNR